MEDSPHTTVVISSKDLTLPELVAVARGYAPVELSESVKSDITRSREAVEKMLEERRVVYGITTGFGSFADRVIDPDETKQLQRNLIESHACGIGNPLPEDVVRAMILLRVKSLSKGHSGIRLVTVEKLIEMLNKKLTPVVPEKGSLGSSGDLCPLSHMVLPLLGKGEAIYRGEHLSGEAAMQRAGIKTIELEAKEGLALNNGTQCMTAIGALAVYDSLHLLEYAEMTAGLTLEALNGRMDAFDPRIHALRGQEGQIESARKMNLCLEGSTFVYDEERATTIRVQDAYALRCIAQVHGASRDAINFVLNIVLREMNAVTDNPLIFYDGNHVEAISGGNFHGQPMALPMDFLCIALAEIANISERRLERMLNDDLSNGLPSYLTEKGGLNSGFMIVQYSAAALVSENKVLAHPASVDSIPSSNNQEDHVSMGTISARKCAEILENTRQVIAMEMLTAAQAVDLRRKLYGEAEHGAISLLLYNAIRAKVPYMDMDRVMAPDIKDVAGIIKNESLTKGRFASER